MNEFSIILPVRNGGEYLKDCVKSILNQTYSCFNLIVLDNCSTDGTKEWIDSLQNNKITIYPSLKTLTIEENWDRIKDVPKNEFMTMIGHDDILLPEYLSEMNNLIIKHPNASLYQAHFNYVDGNGSFIRKCQPMSEVQSVSEFIKCHFLQTLDSMGTGYMFRSADYNMLGGMPTNYKNLIFADYELWIKLTQINYKATTKEKCFEYRLHNSTSKTTNGDEYQKAFEQYVILLNNMQRINDDIDAVIKEHGKFFLMYYCEALSHRILKTNRKSRDISVNDYVKKCISFSKLLIPNQKFNPYQNPRILAAVILDNFIGRIVFNRINSSIIF